MTVRTTRLDSGLTVATDTMPDVETVSLGAFVGVGTRHEPARLNGVAHLLEHMAFKGTARRSARDIAEEIEAVGGQLNAYTGRESTAFHAKVLQEHTPVALDILADILTGARIDTEELQRERQVVLQEIGQAQDTPDDIIFDLVQEAAFPDQGIGRPVLGRPDIVSQLSAEDLRGYMSAFYGSDHMVVAAAGKIEHARFVDMVAEGFAGLPPARPAQDAPARYVGGDYREPRELEQVHVILGLPGVGFRDPDYYTAAVLATLLGGGMSSRLFQKLREERGLVYSVFAFHAAAVDSGLFGIYAGTGEREAPELLPVICEEIGDLAARDALAAELARARAQIKASILMGQESTSGRCEQLANQLLIYGRPVPPAEIVESIETVDAGRVRALAARMAASRPTLASLGPVGSVDAYDRLAARLAA